MAAGGVYIGAEILPHRVMDFVLGENSLEFLDDGVGWLLEGGQGVATVVADEVDVEETEAVRRGADEIGEGSGVSDAIIDVFEEDVGEEDFAVGDGQMLVDGGHDFLDGVGVGDGHKFDALIIEGIVKREGQIDVGVVASESLDTWNYTNSGNG